MSTLITNIMSKSPTDIESGMSYFKAVLAQVLGASKAYSAGLMLGDVEPVAFILL